MEKQLPINMLEPGGILFIVPTPIGNLEDITLRAIAVLKVADIIACEDTRRTSILLKKLDIQYKKILSYYEHNEISRTPQLIEQLKYGKNIALVSDAGTPGVADPGYKIINAAIMNNIRLEVLPGPTAFLPALIGSGFATDKFVFLGFAPLKKGRQNFIKKALENDYTTILYEAPHRIEKLISEISNLASKDRKICIAREISKVYEEYIRGNIAEVKKIINQRKLKGEIVVVIQGKSP